MSAPLRVLHVVSADLWAGAEVATFHLLRALAARSDVEVRVVALNTGVFVERLADARIEVHVEPEAGRSFAALAGAVRRRAAAVDLVHAHRDKGDVLAALSGRPWVSTRHGRPEPFRGRAALRARAVGALGLGLQRLAARRVIAVSAEVAEWLVPRVGRARVVQVPNGIADPALRVVAPRWSQRPRRVGTLARLVPVKALDLALQAVAGYPGLELELVGDGPERVALERQAARSGIAARVRFLGFDPDPLARVARWRALLVTSLHEGHPVAVLEALALGTPIVSAPLRGVAELLGGGGGWIEPTRDPAAWTARLARVVEDEAAGEAASSAARQRFLEAFSVEQCAERVLEVYRGALVG